MKKRWRLAKLKYRYLKINKMNKRTIIITGISSGLGKALFGLLYASGEQLIGISRTFSEYQKTLPSDNATLIACDLSKPDEVTSLKQKLTERLSNVSDVVFINNAGTITPIGSIGEIDDAELIAAAHTNFISPMRITNMLCGLGKIERLTIVHLTTSAARTPIVGWSLYCASKAACKMFFSVLEEQCRGDNRTVVHQFDPGVIDTSMQDKIRQASSKDFPRLEEFKILKKTQKLSDPVEVAKKLISQCIPAQNNSPE